jgi:hypothetical protein
MRAIAIANVAIAIAIAVCKCIKTVRDSAADDWDAARSFAKHDINTT